MVVSAVLITTGLGIGAHGCGVIWDALQASILAGGGAAGGAGAAAAADAAAAAATAAASEALSAAAASAPAGAGAGAPLPGSSWSLSSFMERAQHMFSHSHAHEHGHGHAHAHGHHMLPLGPGSGSAEAMWLALGVSVVSVAMKEWLYRITHAAAQETGSRVMEANAWHHRSDALSSLIAVVGIGGATIGLPLTDPIAGVVVAGVIAKQGLDMAVTCFHDITDRAMDASLRVG